MRFQGKVIVMTGVGGEGQLGEAVARSFATEGGTIVAVDRSEAVEERAAALRAMGFQARGLACDLTDEAQVRALANDVAAAHGGAVHALLNLAGGFAMSGPVGDADAAVWHRQLAINLTTAFLATRAFLPQLRSARGAILYMAAVAALPGGKPAGMAAYAAAKRGLVTLMRAVADEERPHGVRANALAPSAIRTAANITAMGDKVRYVEREQVAAAALFLCSAEAAAVTGQVLELR